MGFSFAQLWDDYKPSLTSFLGIIFESLNFPRTWKALLVQRGRDETAEIDEKRSVSVWEKDLLIIWTRIKRRSKQIRLHKAIQQRPWTCFSHFQAHLGRKGKLFPAPLNERFPICRLLGAANVIKMFAMQAVANSSRSSYVLICDIFTFISAIAKAARVKTPSKLFSIPIDTLRIILGVFGNRCNPFDMLLRRLLALYNVSQWSDNYPIPSQREMDGEVFPGIWENLGSLTGACQSSIMRLLRI